MRWQVLALFLVSCAGEPSIELEAGGFVARTDGTQIELARGETVLLRLPADAFEIGVVDRIEDDLSYDPFWLVYEDALFSPDPPASLRWRRVESTTVEERENGFAIEQTYAGTLTATLELEMSAEGRFSAHWVPRSQAPVAWMRLRIRADHAEAFYGLGEFLDDVNQRGKLRPMQMEPDLSLEGASNEQHVPVPLLIGTNGWGVFVESRRLGLFDVARSESDLVEITYGTREESDAGLRFHLFAAEHPLDITKHYYDLTSPPLLPAEWAYGPLIWRDENRDQAEVEEDIRMIRELDLATSGMWIDRPYASAVNTFDFDPARYPDPGAMIATAHAAGLRMALWHTPYLEEAAGALREEAIERGFFPPRTGLMLNGWSEPIDFTNPDAYAWWQRSIRRYTDMGIEGFKLDYGEDLLPGLGGARTAWEFFDGSDELTAHYDYTLLYHRVYAETLPNGGFLLCRAARWGDQKHVSVIWPGDLDASFAKHREGRFVGGLPASVIMGLTLGPSGFPFYGSDTGGYRHSPPDEETYVRWFQQTALSTVMQVGDSSSQPPWVFTAENGRDEETLALYREYARLHLRLFPYVWSYAERIAVDGRPIQRALGLAHPELGVHPSDEYLMGEHLLVAPVLERNARMRSVTFPEGDWFDWWDGTIHSGEEMVDAPLDKLPLYLRAGGIVPMLRPAIDTLSPASDVGVESYANDAGRLYVRIARGPESRFELYDGTVIEQRESTIHVESGAIFDDGMVLELIGYTTPAAIELNGVPTEWRLAGSGAIRVEVPAGAHDLVLR